MGGRSLFPWRLFVGVPTAVGGAATDICDSAEELSVACSPGLGMGLAYCRDEFRYTGPPCGLIGRTFR